LIELRYKTQKELMHAVQMGNKSKLKEALLKAEGLFDFSERLPNHPLRLMKNQLIIVNTFLRIAAEDGKVPPFYLHHISEKFAVQIERIESIEALNKLYHTMFEEYCNLVKNRAVIGYSLLIQQAVSYLSMHYSEPFSLERISEHCHTHPAHLSRQFKKETGMTLTAFMNKRRIEEAKLLLQNELTSIDLISGYVGFNDAVYFASVFKKFEGMTPSEFRNSKK
jgi:YesN/AraC family two-component response regulator